MWQKAPQSSRVLGERWVRCSENISELSDVRVAGEPQYGSLVTKEFSFLIVHDEAIA